MDVDKLIKEKPELFDYQDVPRGEPDKKYSAAMDKAMPAYIKEQLKRAERS